jgi:hypothetical protein
MFGFFKGKPSQDEIIKRYELNIFNNIDLTARKLSIIMSDILTEQKIDVNPKIISFECMVFLYWITSRTLHRKYNLSRSEIHTIMRKTSIYILTIFSILRNRQHDISLKESAKNLITDEVLEQYNKDADNAFAAYDAALSEIEQCIDKTKSISFPFSRVFISRVTRHDQNLFAMNSFTIYVFLESLLLDALTWPVELIELGSK